MIRDATKIQKGILLKRREGGQERSATKSFDLFPQTVTSPLTLKDVPLTKSGPGGWVFVVNKMFAT